MDTKTLTRIVAVLFVGVAATVTAVGMNRDPVHQETHDRMLTRDRGASDELCKLLRYCRDKGEAALRDPICLKVWIESRDRFFGKDKTPGGMKLTPAAPCTIEPCDKQKPAPVLRGGPPAGLPDGGIPKVKDKSDAPVGPAPQPLPDPATPVAPVAPAAAPLVEEGR